MAKVSPGKGKVILAAVVVLMVAVALFAIDVYSWKSSSDLGPVTVTGVERSSEHRKGTGARYRLTIRHEGRQREGFMDTYWWTSPPRRDEVVDLRVKHFENYAEFRFGSVYRAFRHWFFFLGFTLLALAAYRFFMHRRAGSIRSDQRAAR